MVAVVLCVWLGSAAVAAPVDLRDPAALSEALQERPPRGRRGARLENAVRALALNTHQAGMAQQDRAVLEAAAEVYALYAVHFATHPNAADVRYAQGELLTQLGRHGEAWSAYRAVADHHPQSPRAAYCSEAAVFAAQGALEAGDPAVWRPRLVASLDSHRAHATPEEGRVLRYEAAYALWEHDRPAAVERLVELVLHAPDSDEAVLAGNLVLDHLVVDKDWPAVEARAWTFLDAGFGTPELRVELEELGRRAGRLAAEASDDPDAVRAFEARWP